MKPRLCLPCLLIPFLAATIAPAAAQSAKEQFWEFKDWRASAAAGPVRARQCSASTGGDGDSSLEVSAAAPGDFAVFFREPTARGIRPAMKADDLISFRLDDKQASVFDAAVVNVGVDKEGIPFANAGLPAGNAPDLIMAMLSASSVTVLEPGQAQRQVVGGPKVLPCRLQCQFPETVGMVRLRCRTAEETLICRAA